MGLGRVGAQNGWLVFSTTVPADVTVCGPAATFSMTITNGHTSPVTGIVLSLNLPDGMSYVPGSGVNNGVTEASLANLNIPQLNVPTLAALGGSVTFTFQATSGCDLIAFVNSGANIVVQATANYTGGFDQHTSPDWNVLFASLSFNSITNQTFTGSPGATFTRVFTIINGGNGPLSQPFTFRQINGSGIPLLPPTTPAGTGTAFNYEVTISNYTAYGDGDALFETGEVITVTATYQVGNCALNLGSEFRLTWGCGGDTCQVAQTTGNVVIPPLPPNLVFSVTSNQSSCLDISVPNLQRLRIQNTGSGPAINLELFIRQEANSFTVLDTASVYYTYGLAGAPIDPVFTQTTVKNTAGVRACLAGNPFGLLAGMRFVIDTLPAGQDIYVYFNMHTCCSQTTCNQFSRYNRWSYDANWTDRCQQTPYSVVNILARGGNVFGLGISNSYSGPGTVSHSGGSACFRMEINSSDWGFNNLTPSIASAGGYLEWTVVLPANLAYVPGSAVFRDNDGTIWAPAPGYPVVVGSTLTARYLITQANGNPPPGFTFLGSYFEYCVVTACGTSSTGSLVNTLRLVQNPSCPVACSLPVYCRTVNVSVLCPDPCPNGGANNNLFTYRRTNYGRADDAPQDGLPDVVNSLDMNLVRQDRAMYADTVATTMRAAVVGTLANPTWARGFAETVFSLGQYMTALDATLTVFDASSGTTLSCNNIPVAFANGAGVSRTYTWCFSPAVIAAACPAFAGFTFANGDSITLVCRYRVTTNIGGTSQANVATNQFFLTNVGVPSSTVAPALPADRFYCGNFGGTMTIYGYTIRRDYTGDVTVNGCNTVQLSGSQGLQIGDENYGDYFPFEYRQWMVPDSVTITAPVGWNFTGTPQYRLTYQTGVGTSLTGAYTNFPGANFQYIGTNQLRLRMLNLSNTHGGSIEMGEAFNLEYRYTLRPTCEVDLASLPDQSSFLGRVRWLPIVNPLNPANTINDPNRHNIYYNAPDISLSSPLPVADGTDSVVTWDLIVNNNSAIASAANTWFNLQPGVLANILSVTNLMTSLPVTPINGLYQVGTLPPGGSATYRIRARFFTCTRDSFPVVAGWNCPGYPPNEAAYPCTRDSLWLSILPQPAEYQITLISAPPASTNLCDDVVYEFEVANVQPGTAYFNNYYFLMPFGGGFNPVTSTSEIMYPLGSGTYVPLPDPQVIGPFIRWDISAFQPDIAAKGLPGILQPDSNRFRIRFTLETNCSFISGSVPRVFAAGRMPCGLFTYNYLSAPSLSIIGAATNYNTGLATVQVDTLRPCATNSTFQVKIVNLGPATTDANGFYRFLVDDGASFLPGSYTPILNAPAGPPTSSIVGGLLQLEWPLPAGIVAGDSIMFSFQLDGTGLACGAQEYQSVTTTSSSLICSKTLLPCQVNVSTGSLIDSFEVSKGELAEIPTPTGTYLTGTDQIEFDLFYTNVGDTVNPGFPITFQFFVDVDGSGSFTPGDVALGSDANMGGVVPNNTYNQNPTFSYTGTAGLPLLAVAAPPASACLCDTFTVSNFDITVLPVEFLGLTATRLPNGQVELAWEAAHTAATLHYVVQRSPDALSFVPLQQQPVAGLPGPFYRYTALDAEAPGQGVVYYRIAGVDADGHTTYSNTVALSLNQASSGLQVFPNPTRGRLQVWAPGAQSQPQLLNPLGQALPLQPQPAAQNLWTFETQGLSAGIYMVQVATPTGPLLQRVVVQR